MSDLEDVLHLVEVRRLIRDGRARDIRVAAGLSQAEVADAVGVSRGAVSSWEVGRRAPRRSEAARYGALLHALDRQAVR